MRVAQFCFRFEPMWLREGSFNDVVRQEWISARRCSGRLSVTLSRCGFVLQNWNARNFGSVHKRVKTLKEHIVKLEQEERTASVIKKELKLSSELDEWLAREELLWKQSSRMNWLKEEQKYNIFQAEGYTEKR